MAWLNAITAASTVVVSKSSSTSLVANYDNFANGLVCKIYATTETVVEEYRGLTEAAAKAAVESSNSKQAFRTTYGNSWAVVPALVGTSVDMQASRANEAGGWRVIKTTSTVTAEAFWQNGQSA